MKKCLTLLSTEVGVGIAEDETNGREEVTFAGPIAADDDIVFGRKGLNDRLVLVAIVGDVLEEGHPQCLALAVPVHVPLEALDDDLLDVHVGRHATR